MATLTGKTIASTYTSLLKLEGNTGSTVAGASGNAVQVKTGDDDATPLYLNTDRIGIGTSSPIGSLSVLAAGNTHLVVGSSNAGGAQISLDGDSNGDGSGSDYSYIHHDTAGILNIVQDSPSGTNEIRFGTAGGEDKVVIDANGKVGIGTTSPSKLLHISSTGTAELHIDGGANAYLLLDASSDSDDSKVIFQKNGVSIGSIDYDHNATETSALMKFNLNVAGSADPQMAIKADGKVGIGTTSPATLLTIDQDDASKVNYIALADDGSNRMAIGSDASGTNHTYIQMANNYDFSILDDQGDSIMYFDEANKRAGIGTTSPYALLELGSASDEDYSAATKTDAQLQGGATLGLVNTNTDDENYAQILFRLNQTNTAIARIVAISESNNNVDLAFVSEGGDNATEKLRIKALGNVGVGTAAPSSRLHVQNINVTNSEFDEYATMIIESTEARLEIVADNSGHASGITLSNVVGANDINQWVMQHRGTSTGAGSTSPVNTLAFGYNDAQAGGTDSHTVADSNEILSLTTSGNIGIGNNNPLGALHLPASKGLYWGGPSGGANEHGQIRYFQGEWDASASTTYDLAIGDDAQDNHVIAYEALVTIRNSSSTNGQAWKVYGVSKHGAMEASGTVWAYESIGDVTDPTFIDTGTANVLRITTHNNSGTTGYTVILTQVSVT